MQDIKLLKLSQIMYMNKNLQYNTVFTVLNNLLWVFCNTIIYTYFSTRKKKNIIV